MVLIHPRNTLKEWLASSSIVMVVAASECTKESMLYAEENFDFGANVETLNIS